MIIRRIKALIIVALIIAGMITMQGEANAAALPSAGTVTVSSGRLNVRSSPSSSAAIKTKLNNGSFVTLLSSSGSWWFVKYGKDLYGYCHSSYISPSGGTERKVYTSSGALNIRSGPGTGYAMLASIYSGETVIVLSSSGYWSKILYHGSKTGWVYNTYLGPVSANSGYGSVNLAVPDYKQYDSRWANMKIGSSGKTMAQIGCATTALAMMESYRTGTAISPADMTYRVAYTAGGSIYWLSNYTPVTSASGYLTNVYKLLKQGKPVLIGFKNSYGGQHWVVVCGFTGGSLVPGNFIIKDPGSETRSNLQQLTAQYPVFYKYFYY